MDLERCRVNTAVADSVWQKQSPPNDQQYEHLEPFRFLNFPQELRNQVYENLLCPYPDSPRDLDQDGEYQWSDIAPLYQTAILYTSRQIYTEALEAMLRGNQFVRVLLHGIVITDVLAKVPVQVVAHNHPHEDPVVRDFVGAVMSYVLLNDWDVHEHGATPRNTCDILILGRDLDAFVRGLGDLVIGGPMMAVRVKHHIIIHDPFRKGPRDPEYSNLKDQKRLLQPFRDHFHGFSHVKITGSVDKTLAADVLRQVKHETMPDLEEFIASTRELKGEGNAFFRDHEFVKAIERWCRASAKIQRLRSSRLWPRLKTQGGADFVDTLAELFFNVHSNQTQVALAEIRTCKRDKYGRPDEDKLLDALDKIGHNCHMANAATEMLESAWQPSARQHAKLCFRSALAARLVGNYRLAQQLIERASDLQPNDGEIQREAHEIQRIKAELRAVLGI